MSDYQDFCEAFGGNASDPDFMDNWLAEYCTEISSKASGLQSKIESFNYDGLLTKYNLTKEEVLQIKSYLGIYCEKKFKTQKAANNYITECELWGEFSDIRSLNDHGLYVNIPGILPKFYRITCEVLEIMNGAGAQLTKATKY